MRQKIKIIHWALPALFLLTSFIISCSQNKPRQQSASIKKDTLQPPVIVAATNEFVIRLDTCPKPRTIAVPTKPGSYVLQTPDGPKTIKLLPPEVRPADLFVPMQNYNTEQGLALSNVSCCCQDKKGNLWFGTHGGGVSRYDGKSFTNYTMMQGLPSNDINCIMEGKKGNIWIGEGSGGVSCFDGKSFKNYTSYQGLADYRVSSICEDKNGIMWFGTPFGRGVNSFDGKSFTTYSTDKGLISNSIQSILEDKNGILWFGTDKGISRYDRNVFKNYTTSDGLVNNSVTSIIEDKTGDLWFGTLGGVSKFDGKSFKNYTADDGLPGNSIYSIIESKNGDFWFGTNGGASHFDGKSFRNFTTEQGLANNIVSSIVEDKGENIWFCTEGGGISRYDGKSFTGYTSIEGRGDSFILGIIEDKKGNLWFGTRRGASYFDGKSFTNFSDAQGLATFTYCMQSDKMGNIWFGGKGVYKLDSSRKFFTHFTAAQGLFDHADYLGLNQRLKQDLLINSVLEDKSGALWIAPDGSGVCRLDPDGRSFTNYSWKSGIVFGNIATMFQDRSGNIWFGTYHGLSRLDQERKIFTNYTVAQGLADDNIESIVEDRHGAFWFGTDKGISRYDGKSFLNLTTDQGLANDDVAAIVEDKQGMIWVGTKLGFSGLKFKLKKSEGSENSSIAGDNSFSNDALKLKYEPVFEIYNFKTGYPVKDVIDNSMHVDSKGIIWAGTGDKLVRFDYSGIYKNPNPPNVFIQSIKINNENICWYDLTREKKKFDSITIPSNITEEAIVFGKVLSEADRESMHKRYSDIRFDSITPFYAVPVNLILPYAQNNITFDFAAIEPARPNLVRYQFMLEGYDKQWHPVTDKTTASFGNMHEGNYNFKLKAESPDGIWSEPVVYSLRVLPPWFRTWWFYLLCAVVVVAALYALDKMRVKRLKAMYSMRSHIARDLHDEIGSTLTSINILSKISGQHFEKDQDKAKGMIDEINEQSQHIQQSMSDIVWAINPENDKVENMVVRMREFLAHTLEPKNITIDFKFDEAATKESLTMQQRRDFLLIFKEAINNIAKYALCKNVNISLIRQNANIELMIADDGIGFDTTTITSSNGLKNMKARAAALNGEIKIDSTIMKGTVIQLKVPVH